MFLLLSFSPPQSGNRSAYLGLGREPSYWGQCCLTAGTQGKAGLLAFVFSSDPACVGWAVIDSAALSLPCLSNGADASLPHGSIVVVIYGN